MTLGKQAQALYDHMQSKPETPEVTDEERNEIGRRVALSWESAQYGMPGYSRDDALAAESKRHEARDVAYDLTDAERGTIVAAEAVEVVARETYGRANGAVIEATARYHAARRALGAKFSAMNPSADQRALAAGVADARAVQTEASAELHTATIALDAAKREAATAAQRRGNAAARARQAAGQERSSLRERVFGVRA